jgi:hypothetical protein
MKRQGNWLAWSLQFIVGLVIGGFVGLRILLRRGIPMFWLSPNLVPYFLAGASLLGGGIASHYGDRLWLGAGYIIPNESPNQSDLSNNCSLVAGAAGVSLMVFAICRNLGWV